MMVERRFLGSRKAKLWTFLILGLLLVVGLIVANFALVNPEAAEEGVRLIAGLPAWAFPALAGAIGALIFWVGLKMETDWPEFLGALLIASAVAGAQIMIGWNHFELGGIVVIPYAIPLLVFLILLVVGMVKSK